MISRVTIANYKSIEAADFEARRVNVFIGEPNSGKSNLLEAVALLSAGVPPNLSVLVRIQQAADLFFDRDIDRTMSVKLGGLLDWDLKFAGDVFRGQERQANRQSDLTLTTEGSLSGSFADGPLRYYRYVPLTKDQWNSNHYGGLAPPFGANLPKLLYTNKVLRESISSFFKSKGFRLELRPQDSEILMSKEVDDVLYSFPFESISETMRRMVFYKAALETNKGAVLVLDEPEANTFPFYTKYLAERIALDNSNQFFLSTHNPYVLMSTIEKTPQTELAVYVTRMRNYRTELRALSPEECAEALDLGMSLFFNLDRYFPD